MSATTYRHVQAAACVKRFFETCFADEHQAIELCHYFCAYPADVWNRMLIEPLIFDWDYSHPDVSALSDAEIRHHFALYEHEASTLREQHDEAVMQADFRQHMRSQLRVIEGGASRSEF